MNKIILNGKEYPLLFNGTAMFSLRDIFGEDNIVTVIKANTKEAFEAACKLAAILAEQGELLRRWEGYEPQEILTEKELMLTVAPQAIMPLKNAVIEAVAAGFQRNVEDENEEVDLVLAELNKKKARK